jgi:hypothetical protein
LVVVCAFIVFCTFVSFCMCSYVPCLLARTRARVRTRVSIYVPRDKAGYRRDAGGIQAGCRRDTGGMQAGYRRDISGISRNVSALFRSQNSPWIQFAHDPARGRTERKLLAKDIPETSPSSSSSSCLLPHLYASYASSHFHLITEGGYCSGKTVAIC